MSLRHEEDVKENLKIVFNKLHAAGQLFIEMAKESYPKDDEKSAAALVLHQVWEITTNVPRCMLQLMNSEKDAVPYYSFLYTVFPQTIWAAWHYILPKAKSAFKAGKKKIVDQLSAIEDHLENIVGLMFQLPMFYREVMAVHKLTGVVMAVDLSELTIREAEESYVLIHPTLLSYRTKYTDGVMRHCSSGKSRRQKDTVVYKVPKAYWPEKGKARGWRSEEFGKWLKLVEKEIVTSYDLSYNENL